MEKDFKVEDITIICEEISEIHHNELNQKKFIMVAPCPCAASYEE